MDSNGYIGSPLIVPILDQVADCAVHDVNSMIVGAKGSGTTAITVMLLKDLAQRNLIPVLLDCRAPGTWQESFRGVCDNLANLSRTASNRLVLVVDHAGDLPAEEVRAICAVARQWKMPARPSEQHAATTRGKQYKGPLAFLLKAARQFSATKSVVHDERQIGFRSEVWVGNLDCRYLEDSRGIVLAAEPRFAFQMPEYNSEHLITLYSAIGRRQDSEWGEAILYTILDWCGPDLALADSLGAHFYGDWRNNIYEETVADAIGRWLNTDALVDEYRQIFQRLDEQGKTLISLLNTGGKVRSHSPYCNQEPDKSIRRLFLSGVVSPNLLPGFYQYRNLTMRLLALQSEPGAPPVESLDLLRKYSNGRIGDVLQDAELSLRLLALRCFNRMGYTAVRDKLKATRTDEQAISPDLRRSLLGWAKATGGADQQRALGQHITQYQKDFEARRNLWTRVCGLYAEEIGVESSNDLEPPLAKTVSFMTFAELSNLVLSLGTTAFPRWTGKELGKNAPGKRWPGYMSLLRRLRNQFAHLRNVAFQDIEDLITAVWEMRKDIERYA